VYSPLSKYPSTERVEMQYPVLYVYRQETIDSGGAGEFRGGVGNRFAMAPYQCETMGVLTGGAGQSMTTHSAPGLFGGYPAPTSEIVVLTDTDLYDLYAAGRVPVDPSDFTSGARHVLRTKTEAFPVGPNDVLVHRVPGGGGLGDPLSREILRVAKDVAEGAVSGEVATGIYGVVLTESGEVDESATQALRERLIAQRKSWTPASQRWPETQSGGRVAATGQPPVRLHPRIQSVDELAERVLKCDCGQVLTPANVDYKLGLLVDESPVTDLPLVKDPTALLDEPMVFRRYCCPRCLVLLATEIARAEDGPLPEVVLAHRQG
jgi:N-methylhydantoinase B